MLGIAYLLELKVGVSPMCAYEKLAAALMLCLQNFARKYNRQTIKQLRTLLCIICAGHLCYPSLAMHSYVFDKLQIFGELQNTYNLNNEVVT